MLRSITGILLGKKTGKNQTFIQKLKVTRHQIRVSLIHKSHNIITIEII